MNVDYDFVGWQNHGFLPSDLLEMLMRVKMYQDLRPVSLSMMTGFQRKAYTQGNRE